MKSIYIAVAVLLIFPVSYADINKGLLRHIEWVQQNMQPGRQCVESSAPTTTNENSDVGDLCMSQVCGTADKVQNSEELAISLIKDPEVQKNASKEAMAVWEGINTLLDEVAKEKSLSIEGYRDLQKKKDLAPESSYARLHDLVAMINELKQSSFDPGPNERVPVVVNREATLAKLTYLTSGQRKWVVDNVDHFLRSTIGSDLMLENLTEPRDFLRLKYPNLSFKDALKAEGQTTQNLVSHLLSGPDSSKVRMIAGTSKMFADPVVGKAANGQEMTDAEVSQFMTIRASARLFKDVLTSRDQGGQTALMPDSSRESLSEFIKRKNFDQQITQYEIDLRDAQKVKEKKNVAFQSCYTNYIFQMTALPSASQIEVAKKNGDWAKDRIKEVLGPSLSSHTKLMLNKVIDKSFFSMPRTRESFHQYFMEKLKAAISSSEDVASEYSALIMEGKHKPLTLLSIHQNSDDYTIDNHFKDAQKFCDTFKIELTSDNALSSTGGIETSWVSVRKPEFGKAVMLHELGHIAFNSLDSNEASAESRGHFNKIKQCLADNHPEQAPEGHYVGEDWSDLIAANGVAGANESIGCGLSDQKDDRYSNLQLAHSESDDDHSTDFFRALHIYKVQNGKLPAACNQFIESQGNKWKFNSCL